MALNSYVFIPMGLPVTERAKILGHSVDTNLKYYSFARADDYLSDISQRWDSFISANQGTPVDSNNVIDFTKEKSSRALYSQASF